LRASPPAFQPTINCVSCAQFSFCAIYSNGDKPSVIAGTAEAGSAVAMVMALMLLLQAAHVFAPFCSSHVHSTDGI